MCEWRRWFHWPDTYIFAVIHEALLRVSAISSSEQTSLLRAVTHLDAKNCFSPSLSIFLPSGAETKQCTSSKPLGHEQAKTNGELSSQLYHANSGSVWFSTVWASPKPGLVQQEWTHGERGLSRTSDTGSVFLGLWRSSRGLHDRGFHSVDDAFDYGIQVVCGGTLLADHPVSDGPVPQHERNLRFEMPIWQELRSPTSCENTGSLGNVCIKSCTAIVVDVLHTHIQNFIWVPAGFYESVNR